MERLGGASHWGVPGRALFQDDSRVIWLNFNPVSLRLPNSVGLSSFEWIGNHFRLIGQPADPSTEAFWRTLRRWVQKSARKVPRTGPLNGPGAEIFAFPSALEAFRSGAGRDVNP